MTGSSASDMLAESPKRAVDRKAAFDGRLWWSRSDPGMDKARFEESSI
jgi:hypothetical protein